jgi:hypothetical protein
MLHGSVCKLACGYTCFCLPIVADCLLAAGDHADADRGTAMSVTPVREAAVHKRNLCLSLTGGLRGWRDVSVCRARVRVLWRLRQSLWW